MENDDPFALHRFVTAQEGVYARALAEIRSGQKQTHWMWFVFPQLAGLGFSPTAQRYALRSRTEARAYLAHPVLGQRLREASEAVVAALAAGSTAATIFGYPDDLKLRSCATLFASLPDPDPIFPVLLNIAFNGEPDEATLALLT